MLRAGHRGDRGAENGDPLQATQRVKELQAPAREGLCAAGSSRSCAKACPRPGSRRRGGSWNSAGERSQAARRMARAHRGAPGTLAGDARAEAWTARPPGPAGRQARGHGEERALRGLRRASAPVEAGPPRSGAAPRSSSPSSRSASGARRRSSAGAVPGRTRHGAGTRRRRSRGRLRPARRAVPATRAAGRRGGRTRPRRRGRAAGHDGRGVSPSLRGQSLARLRRASTAPRQRRARAPSTIHIGLTRTLQSRRNAAAATTAPGTSRTPCRARVTVAAAINPTTAGCRPSRKAWIPGESRNRSTRGSRARRARGTAGRPRAWRPAPRRGRPGCSPRRSR